MDRPAAARHAVRGQVHRQVGVFQHLLRGVGPGPPDHRAQPRHQLARAERLDDVVVGAAVEAAHPVGLLGARGQHDDRHRPGRGCAADLPAHLDPRDQRQHPVEQHRIGLALGDAQQRLLAVGRLADRKPLAFEVVAQQRDERRFVLDDEHQRLHCGGARSGARTSRLDLSPFGRAAVSGVPCTM